MPGYVTRLCQELAKQGRTQDEDRERIAKNMEKQDQLNAHKFTVFSDKMNRVLEQQEASHRELQAQQQKMMENFALLASELRQASMTATSSQTRPSPFQHPEPPKKSVRVLTPSEAAEAAQVDEEIEDLGRLPNRGTSQVGRGPIGAVAPGAEGELCTILQGLSLSQERIVDKLSMIGTSPGVLESGDPALGALGLGAVKSAREREVYQRTLLNNPDEITLGWYQNIMRESNVVSGEPFSAKIYGEKCLQKFFEGHLTLYRMWLMHTEIHRLLWQCRDRLPLEGKRALGQTTCNLKAIATTATQNGQWAGAWDYTLMPEPHSVECGISLDERATMGRWLREKAAVDKILEDAKAQATKAEKK